MVEKLGLPAAAPAALDGEEDPSPAESGETVAGGGNGGSAGIRAFDRFDVPTRCRELLRRISLMAGTTRSPPWKWDILELLEESNDRLRDAWDANNQADRGLWQEIGEALECAHTASTLPSGLRKQCEELLGRRDMWLGDFEAELRAIQARGREIRERILFEDVDRAGWFSASGVSPLEVQRLLERHLDMHQRATRLARQLELLCRALQQQGAVSSRRRAFQAKTMGEKLQSSLVCLAAVAVAPVPGSSEMWLATTTMMLLDSDQASQHVVYEHPRDAETETILNQFQCRSSKARGSLAAWLAMPPAKRRGCVLVHNASVRRVIVKTHLVNHIDGYGDTESWTSVLDAHPLGSVMKKAMTLAASDDADDQDKIVVGAQRLAVVRLPPKPDLNWGWRGLFSYGDTKVGECPLREGGVFSFICVDCGLRVGDREEGSSREEYLRTVSSPEDVAELTRLASEEDLRRSQRSGGLAPEGKEAEGDPQDAASTTVEVVNRTDEPVQVKIFEPGRGGHAERLFRSPLGEGTISAGRSRVFSLKTPEAGKEVAEAGFDVEIRIGNRKARCEVAGDQVVFVDGILADN